MDARKEDTLILVYIVDELLHNIVVEYYWLMLYGGNDKLKTLIMSE